MVTPLSSCGHADIQMAGNYMLPGMKATTNFGHASSTCCTVNVQGWGIHQLTKHIIKDRNFFSSIQNTIGKLYFTWLVILYCPMQPLAGQSGLHAY